MNLIDELEREKVHADNMAAAASMWMAKAQEYQRTIFALVNAAGGTIEVPRETLIDLPSLELVMYEQPHSMSVRFITRRVGHPSNKPSNNKA